MPSQLSLRDWMTSSTSWYSPLSGISPSWCPKCSAALAEGYVSPNGLSHYTAPTRLSEPRPALHTSVSVTAPPLQLGLSLPLLSPANCDGYSMAGLSDWMTRSFPNTSHCIGDSPLKHWNGHNFKLLYMVLEEYFHFRVVLDAALHWLALYLIQWPHMVDCDLGKMAQS